MRASRFLTFTGALALLSLCGFTGVQAQDLDGNIAPNGWINSHSWNILFPVLNPAGCGGGGPATMLQNWLPPHDLGTEDPKAGTVWDDIDFDASPAAGYDAGGLAPDPTWFTISFLEAAFQLAPGSIPGGDLVNYQDNIATWLNQNIVDPNPDFFTPLPDDNVLGIATTYVENLGDTVKRVELCTASDDSIQVMVNNVVVVNKSVCRGSSGSCQERTPAFLPPGISKITVLVWEGGGGHNFRLGIMVDGELLTDATAEAAGIAFLGNGGDDDTIVGQEQWSMSRSIEQDPTLCESPDSAAVTLTGAGPGDEGDATTLVETVNANFDGAEITDMSPMPDSVEDILGPGSPLTEATYRIAPGGPAMSGLNEQGFVQDFIAIGPIANPGGNNPGDAALQEVQLASSTDAAISEDDPDYQPVAGDTIPDPIFGIVTANCGACDTINPGGVLTWNEFLGKPNFDFNPDFYGGDVNDNIVAVGFYVEVSEDVEVFFGVGSDDSFSIRVDGEVVGFRSVPRGCGGANSVQDFRGPVTLTAGEHFVLYKVYEGGGGHCGRIGIFKRDRIVTKKLTWNTTRGQINSGISYTIRATSGSTGFTASGEASGLGGAADSSGSVTALGGAVGPFDAHRDIGSPPTPGDLVDNGDGTLTISGSGADIWDGGDNFHFAYTKVEGDFDVAVKMSNIVDPEGGVRWGRLGLMARWTCHNDSAYTFSRVTSGRPDTGGEIDVPAHQTRAINRVANTTRRNVEVDDGSLPFTDTSNDKFTSRRPPWLRLVRRGNTIFSYMAFENPDTGEPAWCQIGSNTDPAMPDALFVGMAAQSHGTAGAQLVSYDISNFSIDQTPIEESPSFADEVVMGPFDYEGDDGSLIPAPAWWFQRSGGFTPQLQGGRARLTEQNIGSSATGFWYNVPSDLDLAGSGFVAEFDAFMTRDGVRDNPDANPADGMTFAVRQDSIPECPQAPPAIDAADAFGETMIIGTDEGGAAEMTFDAGSGEYTNISSTGGDIWAGCDDFTYQYTQVEGDFDVSIEFLEKGFEDDGDGDPGRWGKAGLMARQELTRESRFFMLQEHVPDAAGAADDRDAARVARRADPNGNCDTMLEVGSPIRHPRFFRLTRRGSVFAGFVSDNEGLADGSLDPRSDCNWSFVHSEDWGPDAPDAVFLGFANSEHDSGGADKAIYRYKIITASGGDVLQRTGLGGDGGGALGYHGGTLRALNECHPSFAVELDNWVGGGEPATDPPDGGSPDSDGNYHIGLDTNADVASGQTNVQFGVPTDQLPDIFDPAGVHVTVKYAPSGADARVDVFVRSNAGGGDGAGAADDIQVISSVIPALEGDVIVGFTGGTGGATTTQEVDNFQVWSLVSGVGPFVRGECNDDGNLDLSDAVCALGWLFLGNDEPPCVAALNVNGDGAVDISDPSALLGFLFLGGPPPAAPFPDCGASGEATDFELGCNGLPNTCP